jgi:hypothetical protein
MVSGAQYRVYADQVEFAKHVDTFVGKIAH